jgi:hypothetical protein
MVLHRPVELAALTGKVGTGTKMSGNPTNQAFGKRPLSLSFSRGDFYLASDVVLCCSRPFKAELFPSRGAVSGSLLRLWIPA